MSTSTRITYEQFEEMGRRGDFDGTEDRFELLLGEIVKMTWPKPIHDHMVDVQNKWSFESLPRRAAWVRVQQALGLPELDSLALPDLAWMRRLDYSHRRPLAGDVLLLIEVAQTTLSTDRNTKGMIYAAAGIADYWTVNVRERCVEVRRDPRDGNYQSTQTFRPGQDVRPLVFPDVALPVTRLFPE